MTKPHASAAEAARIHAILADHAGLEGPLLPILHAVQAEFGAIPETALPIIAEALGLSRAEVFGVVSFYPDFRRAAPGDHVLTLCRSEACKSMGADRLADSARAALGIGFEDTTDDGRTTLRAVHCLGLCAVAPAGLVDGRPVGRLTRRRLDQLIAEVTA
ncbi:formate dehydrogenase subunit gamma [Segnochrobactraceae bacterium EtOH-i3]